MIYVLNKDGSPLTPTCHPGKVRHMLRDKKAVIVSYNPFTIQLTKEIRIQKDNESSEISDKPSESEPSKSEQVKFMQNKTPRCRNHKNAYRKYIKNCKIVNK